MDDKLPSLSLPRHHPSHLFPSNRKRMRLSSPPISSDPAIFSSDDDPSADNYTQERQKKRYRGPWYQQRPASEAGESQDFDPSKKGKRAFERQFDSGVFMGSDGTDVEEAEGLEPECPSNHSFSQLHSSQVQRQAQSGEELAKEYIANCLEEGVEVIDLTSKGLRILSNSTIRPLATFTRVPALTEGVFSKLEPKLKLFLASNELTTLPAELFNLDRLTVLSLRANLLHELPPRIGKLLSLRELNLSQNVLRYLPFELLDLFSESGRLQSLNLHPNVFHEPRFLKHAGETPGMIEAPYKIGLHRPVPEHLEARLPSASLRNWHNQWKVTYQARTEIRFFDINGRLLQGPDFPSVDPQQPKSQKLDVANERDITIPPTPRGNMSRAPSLLEVALSTCSRAPQLPYLASMLPEESPDYMQDILALAEAKKESGGSSCTICGRNFIIPRAEWIEWWEIAKIPDRQMASVASPLRQMENERDVLESMVPFIRRACSWLCLPEAPTP